MPLETRTRISILLPAPTTLAQYLLVDTLLSHLMQVCGGVTVSAILPPVFAGWWFNPQQQRINEDQNLLVFADAPLPPDDPDLLAYLDRLKLKSQHDFAQEIIWVTIHGIERIATDDYVR
jgi:hypothetical protein